jgi:hypothetical protein
MLFPTIRKTLPPTNSVSRAAESASDCRSTLRQYVPCADLCVLTVETSLTLNGPFWISSFRNRKGERMAAGVHGVRAAMC